MELPSTNISRNFPGVDETMYYSLAEIVQGDCSGSTDTDSKTDDSYEKNSYTSINKKSGKVR